MATLETALRKLPSAVDSATVPRYFSPSQWTRMESCPLSVWARGASALPERIEVTVGKVFHRARELVLNQVVAGERPAKLADEALDTALIEVDPGAPQSSFARRESVQRELGRCKWIDLVGDLRRWTITVQAMEPIPLRRSRASASYEKSANGLAEFPNEISFGAERTWICNELRLRGRPDESRHDPALPVEIHDYKSSAAAFLGGAAQNAAEVQMRLYLLMAELLTGRPANGFLVGQVVMPVSWDTAMRAELRARVDSARSSFPAGETAKAEVLGRPGSHCMHCDLRPRCKSYLSAVSGWWRDVGTPPRPLPLDVWGRIQRLERDADALCVWLRDAADRLVVVRGVSPAWQLDSLPTSATVYFFGLEATEDLVVHGRRVHPCAFHESARAVGRRPARRLRVYAA